MLTGGVRVLYTMVIFPKSAALLGLITMKAVPVQQIGYTLTLLTVTHYTENQIQ